MLFLLDYLDVLAENHDTRLLQYLVEAIFFSSVDALYHTLPDSFPDEEVCFLSEIFSPSGFS